MTTLIQSLAGKNDFHSSTTPRIHQISKSSRLFPKFPKSKTKLKGDHFVATETIREAVTEKNIPENDFSRVVGKLGDRARSCIECNGDNFE